MLDGNEAPTRAWCERIAKKHAKKAKDKKPKHKDFKAELLAEVKKGQGQGREVQQVERGNYGDQNV